MRAHRIALTTLTLALVLAPLGCGGAASDGAAGHEAAAAGGDVVAGSDDLFDLRRLVAGQRISVRIEMARPYTETLPQARDVPARFEVEGKPGDVGTCAPQLLDRQRGVKLRIGASKRESRGTERGDTTIIVHSGYGDYYVDPPSAYGLQAGEMLRVDCSQHAPIGRVAPGR